MDQQEKEKIAAGLRRCKKGPDFFVTTSPDYPVAVFGIPVYIVAGNVHYYPWGDSGLQLIPVWKDEKYVNNTHSFERGYDEY